MSIASESSKMNLYFLTNELGLRKVKNTTLFRKGNFFVVSPSVQNNSNWFDIGESIIEQYNPEIHEGYLLIRFKDTFLMAKLTSFQKKMMINETQPNSKTKPPHWKFKVMEANKPYILNMGDSDLKFPIQVPSENQLKNFFNK